MHRSNKKKISGRLLEMSEIDKRQETLPSNKSKDRTDCTVGLRIMYNEKSWSNENTTFEM